MWIVGPTLLGLALGTLVLIDLRCLDSTARALSFIIVGVMALAGACAYQRALSRLHPPDDEPA